MWVEEPPPSCRNDGDDETAHRGMWGTAANLGVCDYDYDSDDEVLSIASSEDLSVRGALKDTVKEEVTLMCDTVLQAIMPKVAMGRIHQTVSLKVTFALQGLETVKLKLVLLQSVQ